MGRKQRDGNIKNMRGRRGERGHGVGARVEEPEIYSRRRRRDEGGWEREKESQTWSQVQCFPSASEPWLIMNKFHRERAQSKPEVTERRVRASGLPSPPVSSLHPSLYLYLVCSAVTSTLLSLLRPVGQSVCRRSGNVTERQRRCSPI